MQRQGMRLEWIEVPTAVRDAVAATLGSPVVSAENQPGGFSPGVAARCQLADGRRVFIKCVSDGQNPMSPSLHRREAKVATALPSGIPTPAFLGTIDDGSWVTLIFEEVDGQPPAQPWSMPDLDATFRALDELTAATTPCPVEGLLPFGTQFAAVFDGFRCLAGGGGAGDRLDDWTRRHLDRLADMEAGWAAGASGQSLVHADVRADNLLVRPDGTIVVVDWPHACVGAAWLDKACMLPSVALDGGPPPEDVEAALDPFSGVDPDALNGVLVGLCGYFTYQGRQPDPVGLPTVRAFQRAQAEVARRWLAGRLRLV